MGDLITLIHDHPEMSGVDYATRKFSSQKNPGLRFGSRKNRIKGMLQVFRLCIFIFPFRLLIEHSLKFDAFRVLGASRLTKWNYVFSGTHQTEFSVNDPVLLKRFSTLLLPISPVSGNLGLPARFSSSFVKPIRRVAYFTTEEEKKRLSSVLQRKKRKRKKSCSH